MTYIQPLILIFALAAGLGLLRIRRCRGKNLLMAGVLGLVLLSWPPVDWLFSRPLESRYERRPLPITPMPGAIVVFGSSVDPPRRETPYPLPDQDTFLRCEQAAWLHSQWPVDPRAGLRAEEDDGRDRRSQSRCASFFGEQACRRI